MTIDHGVASNIRRPGRYAEFNIASAARGLVPLQTRVVLIGILHGDGTAAAAELKQIFSEAEADALFGVSSELALMCKFALRGARAYGKSPEIWAIGMAESAGNAAVQTLTYAGTATEDGISHVRIAGRDIRVTVTNGDAAAAVAALIEAEIDAQVAELPVTAGVATVVVTCTHRHKTVNGNDVLYEDVAQPAGITLTPAQSVPGTAEADITASLDLLEDKDYDIIAIANHSTTSIADLATHLAVAWGSGAKRWRHSICAETGSLSTAQTLATAADDFKQMVISCEAYKNTPGEIAAYVGTILAAEDDPALPWNDVTLPDLVLPAKASIPTNAELETGIAGGLFMLSVNEAQTLALIIRAVTTKVTHSSVPYFILLDFTISRSMYYGLRQITIAEALAFPRAKNSARTPAAVRSVVLNTMVKLEDLEIWQNVEALAGQLVVEDDPLDATRLAIAIPASVVPPLNQLINVVNLIVE